MKAKLKLIMEQVGEFDLETYKPESDLFCINILLNIGIDDGTETGDYFDLSVCSSDWLKYYKKKPFILRHLIVIDSYDFREIENYINQIINQCEGDSWQEIANKLSRYFFWEYEDYVYPEMQIS